MVAAAASVVLHSWLFWQRTIPLEAERQGKPVAAQVTRVTFAMPQLQAQVAPPSVVEPEPEPKSVPKPTPKPEPLPKPDPEPKPRPKPVPKPKSKPEPKPVPETKPEPKPQPRHEPVSEMPASAPPPMASAVVPAPREPELAPGEKERVRSLYLQQLMAHIEAAKFYPRTARRRRLEGDVTVSFRLGRDGTVSAVTVHGDGVLAKAAEQALQKALPLPNPPQLVALPLTVEFKIAYRLR